VVASAYRYPVWEACLMDAGGPGVIADPAVDRTAGAGSRPVWRDHITGTAAVGTATRYTESKGCRPMKYCTVGRRAAFVGATLTATLVLAGAARRNPHP